MKTLCYVLAVLFAVIGLLFLYRMVGDFRAGRGVEPLMALFTLLFPFFAVRNWLRARRMEGGKR